MCLCVRVCVSVCLLYFCAHYRSLLRVLRVLLSALSRSCSSHFLLTIFAYVNRFALSFSLYSCSFCSFFLSLSLFQSNCIAMSAWVSMISKSYACLAREVSIEHKGININNKLINFLLHMLQHTDACFSFVNWLDTMQENCTPWRCSTR